MINVSIMKLRIVSFQDELMSNEQLFFGLSQVLRKFPKETGEHKENKENKE